MGAIIRHGAREGNPGSLHQRWIKSHPNYDELIAANIMATRFKQIKSVFKLNFNVTATKKWEEDYDPASKYNHIYQTMSHNMNYVTYCAEKDFTIDVSSVLYSQAQKARTPGGRRSFGFFEIGKIIPCGA